MHRSISLAGGKHTVTGSKSGIGEEFTSNTNLSIFGGDVRLTVVLPSLVSHSLSSCASASSLFQNFSSEDSASSSLGFVDSASWYSTARHN
jgi:hypothetical protein